MVQWGIVYAARALGLLQGLDYVTSTFDWPRQVQQFATLGLLVGLPVVLVTAPTSASLIQIRLLTLHQAVKYILHQLVYFAPTLR